MGQAWKTGLGSPKIHPHPPISEPQTARQSIVNSVPSACFAGFQPGSPGFSRAAGIRPAIDGGFGEATEISARFTGLLGAIGFSRRRVRTYVFPKTKSTTQQPRTCSPPERQCARMSASVQPASSRASARIGRSWKGARHRCGGRSPELRVVPRQPSGVHGYRAEGEGPKMSRSKLDSPIRLAVRS